MNNYYTLIYLIPEWKSKLINCFFAGAVSSRKNTLELFFEGDDLPHKMTFCTDSKRTAFFLDRYQPPRRGNSAIFFEDLRGASLDDITLAENDRFVQFHFSNGHKLIFVLYSAKANALLCQNGLVSEAFKRESELIDKPEPKPKPLTNPVLAEPISLKNQLLQTCPLFPRPVLNYWLSRNATPQKSPENLLQDFKSLTDSLSRAPHPHYSSGYGFSILDSKLLGGDSVRTFASVNEAVGFSFYHLVKDEDFFSQRNLLQRRLHQTIEKLNRAINELDKLKEAPEKAELLEQNGHLLMANPMLSAEADFVEVQDFYKDGSLRKIPLKPGLSLVQNAEWYYERARNGRKSAESGLLRKVAMEEKRRRVSMMVASLPEIKHRSDFEKWLKSNREFLGSIGIGEKADEQASQPFRTFEFGKYAIKVGKSAQANDELLRISHKEDIWLHARGVSGSHVIIPMQRSTAKPDHSVIEYAAKLAAYFSKAKGSSLVPVIFAKRKYIRKPKGAHPGAVKVDREEVILVEPAAPKRDSSEI